MSIVRAVATAATTISSTVAGASQSVAMQVVAAIKGAQAAEAAVQLEAAKQISDTVNRVAATNRRSQIQGFMDDAVSNPCSVVASTGMSESMSAATPVTQVGGVVGRDVGTSGNVSGGGSGAGGSGRPRFAGASAAMQMVLDTAKGSAAAPSPEITAAAATAGACQTFASGGLRARTCEAAGLSAGNAAALPDADLRADTLFDGPQGAQPRKRYSISMVGTDRTAVEAYMRNLNTPVPLRQLSRGELATDKGHQFIAVRDQYEARMSMAERPIRRHISRVSASFDNVPYVDTLLQSEDREFINQFLVRHSPNWQREGISLDEVLQLEVRRRYMNGEWIKRFAAADPGAIAAEQLRVSALQNVLLLQLMEELRESGVSQAAANMATIRQEMGPGLTAAHRAAVR
jgi:hypothetical protein